MFINMLNKIGKAVDSIFHKPDSLFVKAKAKDILFDGLPVDCTVSDFAGSAACNVLKTEAKDLVPDGENRYKFSLFGGVSIVLILKNYNSIISKKIIILKNYISLIICYRNYTTVFKILIIFKNLSLSKDLFYDYNL